jgi:hypothetical protein
MAYDEKLAERVRAALAGRDDVVEKRMFGGIAFMVRGHMSCRIVGSTLMVRLAPADADGFLSEPHVRPRTSRVDRWVGFSTWPRRVSSAQRRCKNGLTGLQGMLKRNPRSCKSRRGEGSQRKPVSGPHRKYGACPCHAGGRRCAHILLP